MIACPNRSSCRTSFPKNFGVANGFRPEGDRTAADCGRLCRPIRASRTRRVSLELPRKHAWLSSLPRRAPPLILIRWQQLAPWPCARFSSSHRAWFSMRHRLWCPLFQLRIRGCCAVPWTAYSSTRAAAWRRRCGDGETFLCYNHIRFVA